jgi:hypothetical protein
LVPIEVFLVPLVRCRQQLVKRPLKATAARRRDGKKSAVEALADGFGHAARTMTDTIDRTDDSVATRDHFLDAVQAILDASIVMEKCRDPRRRRRAQMRNYGRASTKIEDAVWGWRPPGLMARDEPGANVVRSQIAHGGPCCGQAAQLGLGLARSRPRHDDCALAFCELLLQTTKGAIGLRCMVPHGCGGLALVCVFPAR